MKSLRIFSATLVLAVAASAAQRTWTGATDSQWTNFDNWASTALYPGEVSAADTAVIDTNSSMPVLVDDSVPTVAGVTIDSSGAANADLTLKIVSGGTLNVTTGGVAGLLILQAGNGYDAKLWHNAGTFDADILDLRGGNRSSVFGDGGLAWLDFDAAFSVNDDVLVRNEAYIDIANGITVSVVDTFRLIDTDSPSFVLKSGGTGTLSCNKFEIIADDVYPATVQVDVGSIMTN